MKEVGKVKEHEFTKNVEKMVDPIDAGTIHFMQSYTKMIPKNVQNKMITGGAKKNPYMGFVVEPYSFFLCYEIKDLAWAKSLLPNHYSLVPTRITSEEQEAKYYCIFGSFNVHTSAFYGTRMEFYVIAKNNQTGLLSWVIIDYDTNTVSFDQNNGLTGGTTEHCVCTTNYNGEVIIDIKGQKENRHLSVIASLANAQSQRMNDDLWLDGNLSVAYSKELEQNSDAFSIIFNEKEVEKALVLPKSDVQIIENNWYNGLYEKEVAYVICFPYAQHFLSDSPGHFSNIKNRTEMREQVETIDFTQIPRYSSQAIKRAMYIGSIISIGLIMLFILLYIMK